VSAPSSTNRQKSRPHALKSQPKDRLEKKGLPCNPDAERFILANILIDGRLFREAENHGLKSHLRVFSAIQSLHARGEDIDRVTVAEELSRRDQTNSGILSLLFSLDEGMPHVPHIASYVQIVLNKSVLRRLITVGEKFVEECALELVPPSELIKRLLTIVQVEDQRCASSVTAPRIRSVLEVPFMRDSPATPIRYLEEPLIIEGTITGLTGDAGSGKSTVASAIARRAHAAGHPVLILDRENPKVAVEDRFRRLGIIEDETFRVWGSWIGEEAPDPGSQIVMDWVKACTQPPLIIIDTKAAFMGGDENSATETRVFMKQLIALAGLGATLILVHHDGKAESARDYRGSSDFKAAVDQAFHVTNHSEDGHLGKVVVRCYKSRFGFSGQVVYDYAHGELSLKESGDRTPETLNEKLTSIIRTNPGICSTAFEKLAAKLSIPNHRAREFLAAGILTKSIRREAGKRMKYHHFLASAETGT
jgi:hypothetical protein